MRNILQQLQGMTSLTDDQQDLVAKIKGAISTFENAKDLNKNNMYCSKLPADLDSREFKAFFAKYETAWDFYHNSNYNRNAIPGHLNGIDFRQPVEIVKIPPPGVLQQFQSAKSTWQGGYYAAKGTPPESLGIAPGGSQFDPVSKTLTDKTLIKTPNFYEVVAQLAKAVKDPTTNKPKVEDTRTPVLKTIAAPITDNWSYKDKREVPTPGGGVQYFCANAKAFRKITELDYKPTTPTPAPSSPSSARSKP